MNVRFSSRVEINAELKPVSKSTTVMGRNNVIKMCIGTVMCEIF